MQARPSWSLFGTLLLVLGATPGLGQTPPPARPAAGPPADVLDRLKVGRTSVDDATKALGPPRAAKDGIVEYGSGGYVLKFAISTDAKSGHPVGTILGLMIAMERPRRVRDPQPVLLNGYWTPKTCDEAGQCGFELGSFNPLHVARLKDLGLDKRCNPALREDIMAIRYSCSGSKANDAIDVEVQADLKFGLEGDLAARAERARLILKIRAMENDPNDPERAGAKSMRTQFGVVGSITNESIWSLVKDLPVASYGMFTNQPSSGGSDERLRTATSLAGN